MYLEYSGMKPSSSASGGTNSLTGSSVPPRNRGSSDLSEATMDLRVSQLNSRDSIALKSCVPCVKIRILAINVLGLKLTTYG